MQHLWYKILDIEFIYAEIPQNADGYIDLKGSCISFHRNVWWVEFYLRL